MLACDALLEYWESRENASGPGAQRAHDDAASLRDACEVRGVSSACAALALMTRYGTVGARDVTASNGYFARLRELGDLFGFRGQPASPAGDAARARQQSECDGGRSRACVVAGWAAFGGVLQGADTRAAYAAWQRSCELGNGTGCRWAGHLAYTHPEVGAEAEAERLLRRACDELHNPGGCDELGVLLQTRSPDAAASTVFFDRACEEGSRSGCLNATRRREQLAGHSSDD